MFSLRGSLMGGLVALGLCSFAGCGDSVDEMASPPPPDPTAPAADPSAIDKPVHGSSTAEHGSGSGEDTTLQKR